MSIRFMLAAIVLVLACLLAASPAAAQERYPAESNLLEILFIQESSVRLIGGEPVDLSGLNATAGVAEVLLPRLYEWERLAEVPEPVIDAWEIEGEAATGGDLYNLNNIYRLRLLVPAPDLWLLAADLEALPGVHLAYPVPLPQELPVPGSFLGLQGYLNPAAPAPAGVDAFYAWTLTGGNGAGVTVCDIEYDWNTNHQDLTKAPGSQINLNVSDPFAATAYPSQRHGTAVLGELVSDSNGWGTTGVSPGASPLTCGSFYGLTPSWNVAGAMTVAMAALQAGDVILLEQQWDYSGTAKLGRYVPIEWWNATTGMAQQSNAVYYAIQTAVANGIHVVEAGGNGNVDTGAMTWWGDSGAIIVGAGGTGLTAHGDRVRMGFSSYGPRFDLQGWGENVATTGHNFDLYSAEGLNLHYTRSFSGTSSASPIVAGAVVCVQGWWAGSGQSTPISPALMRSTLKLTGTAQDSTLTGNIGPRPDLQAAITALTPTAQWADATSGPLGDTGLTNSIAWGDRDGDGDPDLYLVNFQSNCRLLENFGGGVFQDFSTVPEINQAAGGAAAWGDYDNDGDPDLYVGNWVLPNRLLRNDLFSFFDAFRMPESDAADAAGVAWVDYDNDGWLDLHVTTVNGLPDKLFRNLNGNPGPGGFVDLTGPPLDDMDDSRDGAWADYDNDGDQDLYLTKFGPQPSRMLRNDAGTFVDVSMPPLLDNGPSNGACWGDYDNDGDLDLYLVNSSSANRLFRNDGTGFTDDTNGPLGDTGAGRAAAFADYDSDGDLDLYLANFGSPNRLMRNDISNGNSWLQVKLIGTVNNASGIGARVTVWSPTVGRQMREVSDMTAGPGQGDLLVEFGLAGDTVVDSLRVDWPNGRAQRAYGAPVNLVAVILDDTGSAVAEGELPVRYALRRAWPNPFNPSTTIEYDVPRAGLIDLSIFDAAGRLVRRLVSGTVEPGRRQVVWDGRNQRGGPVGSGVYLVRLEAADAERPLKLTLLK